MPRRWRTWRGNPGSYAQIGAITTAAAGLTGAASGGDRSVFIMLALVFTAATGWYEGRYAEAVGEYWPRVVRRGALIRLGLGVLFIIAGWFITAIDDFDDKSWIDTVAAGLLFCGLALVVAGAARLIMTVGAQYVGRKLQDRLDDDF